MHTHEHSNARTHITHMHARKTFRLVGGIEELWHRSQPKFSLVSLQRAWILLPFTFTAPLSLALGNILSSFTCIEIIRLCVDKVCNYLPYKWKTVFSCLFKVISSIQSGWQYCHRLCKTKKWPSHLSDLLSSYGAVVVFTALYPCSFNTSFCRCRILLFLR